MASSRDAWQTFLRGRIEEEKKNFADALKAYDAALAIDANNTYFLRSKANLLTQTGETKAEDPEAENLRHGYKVLASTLVDANDQTEAWVSGIEKLLEEPAVERLELAPAALVFAW